MIRQISLKDPTNLQEPGNLNEIQQKIFESQSQNQQQKEQISNDQKQENQAEIQENQKVQLEEQENQRESQIIKQNQNETYMDIVEDEGQINQNQYNSEKINNQDKNQQDIQKKNEQKIVNLEQQKEIEQMMMPANFNQQIQNNKINDQNKGQEDQQKNKQNLDNQFLERNKQSSQFKNNNYNEQEQISLNKQASQQDQIQNQKIYSNQEKRQDDKFQNINNGSENQVIKQNQGQNEQILKNSQIEIQELEDQTLDLGNPNMAAQNNQNNNVNINMQSDLDISAINNTTYIKTEINEEKQLKKQKSTGILKNQQSRNIDINKENQNDKYFGEIKQKIEQEQQQKEIVRQKSVNKYVLKKQSNYQKFKTMVLKRDLYYCDFKAQKLCYFIWVLIYAFLMLLLSIIAYSKKEDSTINNYYTLFLENLQSKFIIDISVIDSSQSCANNSGELISYAYEGTHSGCDCNTDSNNKSVSKISKDSCSSSQQNQGCSNISGIGSQNLKGWALSEDEKDEVKICGVYSTYSYLDALSDKSDTCASGEKICGGTEQNFRFCIPDQQNCPINYIGTEKPSDADSYSNLAYVLPSDSSTFNIYQSDSGNYDPILAIRVAEGDQLCYDPAINHYDSGIQTHPLMKQEETDCTYNSSVFSINQISQERFLYSGGLQSKLEEIPLYTLITKADFQYTLYAQKYSPWYTECRGQENVKDLLNNVDKYDDVKLVQLIQVIICGIYFLVGGVFIGIYFVKQTEDHILNMGVIIVKSIFFVILGVGVYITYLNTYWFNSFLAYVHENECSSANINAYFQDYNNSKLSLIFDTYKIINRQINCIFIFLQLILEIKDSFLTYDTIIFIILHIAFIFELYAIIRAYRSNRYLQRKQENGDQQIDDQKNQKNNQGNKPIKIYKPFINPHVENYYTGDTLQQYKQQEILINSINGANVNPEQRVSYYESIQSLSFQSLQNGPHFNDKNKKNSSQSIYQTNSNKINIDEFKTLGKQQLQYSGVHSNSNQNNLSIQSQQGKQGSIQNSLNLRKLANNIKKQKSKNFNQTDAFDNIDIDTKPQAKYYNEFQNQIITEVMDENMPLSPNFQEQQQNKYQQEQQKDYQYLNRDQQNDDNKNIEKTEIHQSVLERKRPQPLKSPVNHNNYDNYSSDQKQYPQKQNYTIQLDNQSHLSYQAMKSPLQRRIDAYNKKADNFNKSINDIEIQELKEAIRREQQELNNAQQKRRDLINKSGISTPKLQQQQNKNNFLGVNNNQTSVDYDNQTIDFKIQPSPNHSQVMEKNQFQYNQNNDQEKRDTPENFANKANINGNHTPQQIFKMAESNYTNKRSSDQSKKAFPFSESKQKNSSDKQQNQTEYLENFQTFSSAQTNQIQGPQDFYQHFKQKEENDLDIIQEGQHGAESLQTTNRQQLQNQRQNYANNYKQSEQSQSELNSYADLPVYQQKFGNQNLNNGQNTENFLQGQSQNIMTESDDLPQQLYSVNQEENCDNCIKNYIDSQDGYLKSVADSNIYSQYDLKNGIRTLIVEQEENQEVGISVIFDGLGGYSDPENAQGTAHFLEGKANGMTYLNWTMFPTLVSDHNLLDEIITRVSNFIINPQLNQEQIIKEIQAIESEFFNQDFDGNYKFLINKINVKKQLLQKGPTSTYKGILMMTDPNHPFHKIFSGNYKFLKQYISDPEKLRELRKNLFEQNQMYIVVLTHKKEDKDKIIQKLEENFGKLETKYNIQKKEQDPYKINNSRIFNSTIQGTTLQMYQDSFLGSTTLVYEINVNSKIQRRTYDRFKVE
ncbi:Metalloenzyme, LuxS/M16 peptidase-like protein [Pseudocohnilembus persalinus]|uniref:Metalloenzyme, LuxS/M16 peptidase-like protein n=1 Tax=Pseudocohnilembus persalinus TaxID=266149 RepID=A0A0V0QEC1_PSEPJ|nr:Metalloenzyme, LuxS/M16 peptidase-like protein [Pseudocohnilembus persalinus]|eukprot:KRX00577.1 Metalloenzyme, LuxS/M16 peptidase-like protein [Pseudocohnilembus persalinus]